MKLKFKFEGPKGDLTIDHTEIAAMSDAQIESYVAAKVRKAYEYLFNQVGIEFYLTYNNKDYHTTEPSKEIAEV